MIKHALECKLERAGSGTIAPETGMGTGVEKRAGKKSKKDRKKTLTRVHIFGKIIKLSGRHAGTKTTKKRQWLAWKWTEKAPRKVKKSS